MRGNKMFYCDECARKNGYPIAIFKSYGPCECCGKITACNERKSGDLKK
jgi:hypothetical protein